MRKLNNTRLCLINANNNLGKEMKEMEIITYLQKKIEYWIDLKKDLKKTKYNIIF